ncbi:MAG: DUF4373 domain-containing protein [Bacteroidaceae bacterium]|nr:DUF4373 domain-containing protein [Bacteroidaceae bacterium]
MARNQKIGFDFYRVDTDRYQDIRIKKLKKNYGCNGIAVYDYVLCEIYRVKGCFLEWDESTTFDVAEYFGLKENTVSEIMRYCGSVGLFDKELLSRGIVTSASIQKRYLDMCQSAKRANATIPESCNLITDVTNEKPISSEEMPISSEEMPISSEESTHSRVEYSRVEYSREKNTPPPNARARTNEEPPAPNRGGDFSSSLDKGFIKSQLAAALASTPNDYYEAIRLTSNFTADMPVQVIAQWLDERKRGGTRPFYEIIQLLQRLENNGQLTTTCPDRILWQAMVAVRTAREISQTLANELLQLACQHADSFKQRVNEWLKNKAKINSPYNFIRSALK